MWYSNAYFFYDNIVMQGFYLFFYWKISTKFYPKNLGKCFYGEKQHSVPTEGNLMKSCFLSKYCGFCYRKMVHVKIDRHFSLFLKWFGDFSLLTVPLSSNKLVSSSLCACLGNNYDLFTFRRNILFFSCFCISNPILLDTWNSAEKKKIENYFPISLQ